MLRFKSLSEVYQGFKENKVPMSILQQTARYQKNFTDDEDDYDISKEFSIQEITQMIESSKDEEYSFIWLLGGDLFICETAEDLKEIEGFDLEWAEKHNNKWPNVTDIPMAWDDCNYLNKDKTTGWAFFLLCTNNSGGPIYYVPENLWEKAKLVEHMAMHNQTWSTGEKC